MIQYLGLAWLCVLTLDAWALISLPGAEGSVTRRLLWALGIAVLPVIGFLAWVVAGPSRKTA